jgi:hypothetical protein
MVKFDPSEVLQYFSIVEKCATVTAGRHSHIAGEAMSRLNAIEEGLVNEKRKQQGLAPEPSPMAQNAAANIPPAAEGSDQLERHPTPSKPVEPPKSTVAAEAVGTETHPVRRP